MKARFALVLACFFLSGFAALLYQTAWTRELGFVFGTSELAVAAVLAGYMGGLALGAAIAAHLAPRLRRPVLAYGILELGVAVGALAVPAGLALVTLVYVGVLGGQDSLPEGSAPGAALFQLIAAFAVLVPPTALMGATLPLLARDAVRRESEIGSRIGLLYGLNTAGAIAGTLFAAFQLIPALGLRATVYVGVAVNALVFVIAALARGAPLPPATNDAGDEDGAGGGRDGATLAIASSADWVLPVVALSGAVSFSYEVLWNRLLGHVLGASTYAFSTMLASFLLGIALGSSAAGRFARSRGRAVRGFALAQLGIAVSAFGAFALCDRLPDLARGVDAGHGAPLPAAAITMVVLLPMTFCIGATFPFAVRLFALRAEQAAAASARIYAWNTVGAIAGAVGTGFVLIPALGFAGTLAAGVGANLALAAVAVFMAPRIDPGGGGLRRTLAPVLAIAAVLLVALLPASPWRLLRTSPYGGGRPVEGPLAYAGVGRSATVLLVDQGLRWNLLSGGLPESMIDRPHILPIVYAANWLSVVPALLRPAASDALLIGFGGGLAVESLPSSVASVDAVELEEEILAANRAIALQRARDPLADPRLRLHIGDARGALMLTNRDYDIAISQPSHPWTSGSSHLYTREFFELVDSRLRPGGVFVQWIGIDMIDGALLKSLVATLLAVFPHVEVYQPNPFSLIFAASHAALDSLSGARIALAAAPAEFARYGVYRVEDFAVARVLDEAGAREFAEGASMNTDDRNELAMRASRLGDAALDAGALQALLAPYEPIDLDGTDLHASALVRSLLERGFTARAAALAAASRGLPAELANGWIQLHQRRPRSAAVHFARALAGDPASVEAQAGLVASQRAAIERGAALEGLVEQDLPPPIAAVAAAWRATGGTPPDWQAVAARDAELAQLAPGDALFLGATRLRAQWRIDSGRPEAGAEALRLSEVLSIRRQKLDDLLLRAQAAAVAGDVVTAWYALSHLSNVLHPAARVLARTALALADSLPSEPGSDAVRARLAAASR